jgi:preprotein translocase subunit YajC
MYSYLPLIIMLLLLVAMVYFMMIKPLRKREQQHDSMVMGLQKGDLVITAGGMYGEVDTIDEDSVVLIVESGAKVRVTKGGVLKREDENTGL